MWAGQARARFSTLSDCVKLSLASRCQTMMCPYGFSYSLVFDTRLILRNYSERRVWQLIWRIYLTLQPTLFTVPGYILTDAEMDCAGCTDKLYILADFAGFTGFCRAAQGLTENICEECTYLCPVSVLLVDGGFYQGLHKTANSALHIFTSQLVYIPISVCNSRPSLR
jgi:hypothetical protein